MNNNEYHIQVALVQWLHVQYPKMLFTISPSGMKLNIGQAVKLKRMGYRAGTPDLAILEPRGGFHGLFIELKTEDGVLQPNQEELFIELKTEDGVLQPNQKEFLRELIDRKYHATICFGFDEAQRTIINYMKMPNYEKTI
jgi:hypothetical protein